MKAPDGLKGTQLFLDEASVTGTENAVMAAVLAAGRDGDRQRRLRAARPGSLPLPRTRWAPGSTGIGSNVLRIEGVERLHGGEWRICADHIEVASFIGLGAVTEGEIVIEDVDPRISSRSGPGSSGSACAGSSTAPASAFRAGRSS